MAKDLETVHLLWPKYNGWRRRHVMNSCQYWKENCATSFLSFWGVQLTDGWPLFYFYFYFPFHAKGRLRFELTDSNTWRCLLIFEWVFVLTATVRYIFCGPNAYPPLITLSLDNNIDGVELVMVWILTFTQQLLYYIFILSTWWIMLESIPFFF